MGEIARFKKQIYRGCGIIALIAMVVSLPFLGFDWRFFAGVALGTGTAILNFEIMAFIGNKILDGSSAMLSPLSFLLRMGIYCLVFYELYIRSHLMGWACFGGFFTLQLSMFWIHGIMPSLGHRGAEDREKEASRAVPAGNADKERDDEGKEV